MNITILCDNPFGTNCYILTKNNKAVVIDPNFDVNPILEALEGYTLESILLTHGHFDHITALNELKVIYPYVPVYTHQLEIIYLTDISYNLSSFFTEAYTYNGEVTCLLDNQAFINLETHIIAYHAPGHSLGSLCYYFKEEGIVFSGDTLFKNSVGRTDMKGCNSEELIISIKSKLLTLDEETVVYPGHGNKTSIGLEKKHNIYLR